MDKQRYLVFAGFQYYPGGGWEDFVGSFPTLEEAQERGKKSLKNSDWYHIVDLETSEIRVGGNTGSYG